MRVWPRCRGRSGMVYHDIIWYSESKFVSSNLFVQIFGGKFCRVPILSFWVFVSWNDRRWLLPLTVSCPSRFANSYLIFSSSVVIPSSMLYISRTLSGNISTSGCCCCCSCCWITSTCLDMLILFIISNFIFLSSSMSLHILRNEVQVVMQALVLPLTCGTPVRSVHHWLVHHCQCWHHSPLYSRMGSKPFSISFGSLDWP